MSDDRASAVTALAMTECILAELTARLGPDFGNAIERRMVAKVKAAELSPQSVDRQDAEALTEGMEMIRWHSIIGRHPFSEVAG
ncbi:hypothetical protein ACQKE8_12885 [Sphingobium limneticum]|uniref:hypothetical protein n=1 Tax=Sphingobium limneticum TaxID=1007511 RepID=UPI003CFFE297